jgi:hypothetical protein
LVFVGKDQPGGRGDLVLLHLWLVRVLEIQIEEGCYGTLFYPTRYRC